MNIWIGALNYFTFNFFRKHLGSADVWIKCERHVGARRKIRADLNSWHFGGSESVPYIYIMSQMNIWARQKSIAHALSGSKNTNQDAFGRKVKIAHGQNVVWVNVFTNIPRALFPVESVPAILAIFSENSENYKCTHEKKFQNELSWLDSAVHGLKRFALQNWSSRTRRSRSDLFIDSHAKQRSIFLQIIQTNHKK